jgi:hypothetical protein
MSPAVAHLSLEAPTVELAVETASALVVLAQ